jgi:FKBP-type peptidyl-prolyl cis-trans isomerase
MKTLLRFTFISFLIIAMTSTLTGCGSDTDTTATDADGYITNASGLKYKELVVGEGATAKAGDTVSVHYTGTLTDGTKFDSSVDRGAPFQFVVDGGQVIAGWDEGLQGMNVGGKRELYIPSDLAYGERSVGAVIPANATLVFEVELLEIL